MDPLPMLTSFQRVLCIGAHPDDIEIGCGATLRLLSAAGTADIRWLVLTSNETRAPEVEASAVAYLGDVVSLTLHGFRDGYLPFEAPAQVKDAVVAHRHIFTPDLVLSPRHDDAHQDHRFLAELALQVYRTQPILEYEIPKFDGDLATANVYVPVSADAAQRKVDDLHAAYPSQVNKPWFDADTFLGLMRLRGMEAAAPSGLAEAFVARKLVLG